MKNQIEKRMVCVIVGIIFLSVSFYLTTGYENKKKELDSETQSIQTTYTKHHSHNGRRSRTVYTPEYHFIVGNSSYVCTSAYSNSSKPNNKKKKIYYNSKNPGDCLPENGFGENILSYALLIAGILAMLTGFFGKEQ